MPQLANRLQQSSRVGLLAFRSPVFWLLLLALSLAWIYVGPRSETTIQLEANGDQIIGSVNGASLPLDLSANPVPVTGTLQIYTAPPETSQYYQAGEPAGPLAFLGYLGELVQQARPAATWRFIDSNSLAPAGNPTPYADFPPAPYRAPVVLVGARVATGFVVGAPGGPQYAFTIRPERRNLSWWTFEQGRLTRQLDSSSYRVAGWATVADLLQELALLLAWTSVVVLLTMGLGRLLAGLLRRSAFVPAGGPLADHEYGTNTRMITAGMVGTSRHRRLAELVASFTPLIATRRLWRTFVYSCRIRGRQWLPLSPTVAFANAITNEPGGPEGPTTPDHHAQYRPAAQAPTQERAEPSPPAVTDDPTPAASPSPRRGEGRGEGQTPRTTTTLWALLFGLVAFVLALWACLGPLEGIPHVQDDVAYIFQAKIFALRSFWVPAPPLPQFFEQGFIVIQDGHWFAKYPPGFPLLLAPFELLQIDWLVNPLCAGFTIALVYLTGRTIYGHRAGFWAALLGALSPFVIFMSGSFMSHPSTMFWLALFLYCFVRGVARPGWLADPTSAGAMGLFSLIFPLAAGFAASWAFISREATAVGVVVPFVIWALIDLAVALRHGELLTRLRPYLLIVLGAVPPILVLGVVNQAQMGSPFHLAQELVGTYDRLGFGVGFGPEPEGHSLAIGLYNALVYLRELQAALFGWPLLLTLVPLMLAFFAAVDSLRRREWKWRWDLLLFGGFLGLVGIYLAWWSSTTIFGPRYWYEGTPFLLLLAGRGIAWLGDLASPAVEIAATTTQNPPSRVGSAVRWLAPGIIVGLLLLFNFTQYFPGQVRRFTGYNDVTASAVRRVEQAQLSDALVFVALQPAFPSRDYGKVFFANDPLLRGRVIYARDLGPDQNRLLLAQFPDRQAYYLPLEGPVKPGVSP